MNIDQELKGSDLMFTTLLMLLGDEGKDFSYYKFDAGWWESRLYQGRN